MVGAEQVLGSGLASTRLRAGSLITAIPSDFPITFGERVPPDCRILLVGKIGADNVSRRSAEWLSSIETVRRSGGAIVCDYTDHHLGFSSPMRDFYARALEFSTLATVPSTSMGQLLREFYSGPISIIPDAVEVAIQAPQTVRNSSDRRLLWFGHGSNLSYLLNWMRELKLPRVPYRALYLKILTDNQSLLWLSNQKLQANVNMHVSASVWSLDEMTRSAAGVDVCVIPSDPSDLRKRGVSSNRLITAIALGLPVAADSIESYLEFQKYFTNLRSADFEHLLEFPGKMHSTLLEAQRELLPRFSMRNVGKMWLDLIAQL
jgi:hypothetical protein